MSRSTSRRSTEAARRRPVAALVTSRRGFLRAGAAALGGALFTASPASARQAAAGITATDLGGVTLLQGAGANVVALAGADGALMVDGGRAASAEALLAAVRSATG